MNDLTVIMLTLNKLPELWCKFYRATLDIAIEGASLITISKIPMNWGLNLIQKEKRTEREGVVNIYAQILRGAKIATTKYIAIAEDDTLYPAEHFKQRPERIGYNLTRWCIFAWETRKPFFFHKPSPSNSGMIALREDVIELLEARFAIRDRLGDDAPHWIYKELGRRDEEHNLGKGFHTHDPILCFHHDWSVEELQRRHKKKPWPVRAYEIPKWGQANDIIKRFV